MHAFPVGVDRCVRNQRGGQLQRVCFVQHCLCDVFIHLDLCVAMDFLDEVPICSKPSELFVETNQGFRNHHS